MTLRSRTVANLVRISSFIPSAKYAFAFSSLKFSKGRRAIDLSILCAAPRGRRKNPAIAETITPTPASMPTTRTLFFGRGKNGLNHGGRASGVGICNRRAISLTDCGRRPGSFARQAATHSSHSAGIGPPSISNSFRRSVIDGGIFSRICRLMLPT